jgi:hypothetical protein
VVQSCFERDELIRLLDGEQTANRAEAMRAHLVTCARCRAEADALGDLLGRVREPLEGSARSESVNELMERIASEPVRRTLPGTRRRLPIRVGLAGGAALAASVLVAVGVSRRGDGEFGVRGGSGEHTLSQLAAVALYALEPAPRLLRDGAVVRPNTRYVVQGRNLTQAPVFALVFAVDGAGTVHWLQPGYTSEATDPASVSLAPGQNLLPEGAELENVAPGILRVVSVVSREPLRVSAIERLPRSGLKLEALRQRFPEVAVEELRLELEAGTPRGSEGG